MQEISITGKFLIFIKCGDKKKNICKLLRFEFSFRDTVIFTIICIQEFELRYSKDNTNYTLLGASNSS